MIKKLYPPVEDKNKPRKRGRNPELIKLRNEALIRRFYYWSEIERRRFDDILQVLSTREFFIDETTIYGILVKNTDAIGALTASKPTARQLELFGDNPKKP